MMPFQSDGVQDDQTIYLAISCHDPKLAKDCLASVPASLEYLKSFRLMLMLFNERLADIRVFNDWNIYDIFHVPIPRPTDTSSLNPIIGLVLADRDSAALYQRPRLYMVANHDVPHSWNDGLLSQMVAFHWITGKDKGRVVPFGMLSEIDFPAVEPVASTNDLVEQLTDALRPFGLTEPPHTFKDDQVAALIGTRPVSYGDFRRAYHVLSENKL